jgi:hypothetical protein
MSAESIVKTSLANVPKALAAGVVDMKSGLFLSIRTVESHPQRVLDLLAPATRDLFEGEMVLEIENQFKQARGAETEEHYFQEIMVSSTHLWHYFGRLKSNPATVLVVVSSADVNLGLFLAKAREIAKTESV